MPEFERREPNADERELPRWQAPPGRRDVPTSYSTPSNAPVDPPDDPSLERSPWTNTYLIGSLLTLVLLLLGGMVLLPSLRAEDTRPRPLATALAPTRAPAATVFMPPATGPIGCFSTLTLDPIDRSVTVGRDAAEATLRDGYDLPFRLGRLGTLTDARLVTLGYRPPPFVAPMVQATQAASVTGDDAWLLAFARTPPLADPALPARLPLETTAYFLYALIDATTGAVITTCNGMGTGAMTEEGPLPSTPMEGDARQTIDAARAAVAFPVRVASWLPFPVVTSFARVSQLPGAGAEVVADYFAVAGDQPGARVRVISTTQPPLLAASDRGGTPVALADGRAARFDDLSTLQVLTWAEGAIWYQIVATGSPSGGTPYTAAELRQIAEGVH